MGRFVDGLIRRFLMSPKRFGRILAEVEQSEAHAELCTRVYGRNLGQFNAATMLQLEKVISVLGPSSDKTLFDIGCGAGLITEYLVDATGASAIGFDFAAEAVRIASDRSKQRRERVRFESLDLNIGELPENSADAIVAIDSLYPMFFAEFTTAVGKVSNALRPDGRLVVLYTQIASKKGHRVLTAGETDLANALVANGLSFAAEDFSDDEREVWLTMVNVAKDLKSRFKAEGRAGLCRMRLFEARKMSRLAKAGRTRRYLYVAQRDQ